MMINQDARVLAADELDAVTGGIITAVFEYGGFRMEMSAWDSGYMVYTHYKGRSACTVVESGHGPIEGLD